MKPSDYYFWPVDVNDEEQYEGYEDFEPPWIPEVDATIFYICPRNHYDKFGYLYDGCIRNEVKLPDGFGECQESCYEIAASKEEGRRLLLEAGFVEKYIGPPWGKRRSDRNTCPLCKRAL